MTRRRKPFIRLRKPIYVGCEGASEVGYTALLQDFLAIAAGVPIYIKIDDLGSGAGDPLARIELAVRRITSNAAGARRRRQVFRSSTAIKQNAIRREPRQHAVLRQTKASRSSGNVRVLKRCSFATCQIALPIGRPIQ